MSKVLLMMLLTIGLTHVAWSQKLDTYTSSNGMEFNIGDTVTLGVGSSPNGNFNHIYSGIARTVFASMAEEADYDPRLPEFFHGAPVVIKKIKMSDNEAFFMFDTDGWGGYVIDIEKAIKACEVAYCRPTGFLSQQEYEKLILLYQAVLDEKISAEKFEKLRAELLGLSVE